MMNPILHPFVENFMLTNDLKTDIHNFFELHLETKTLEHTLVVANEARRVAQMYKVDPWKAEQAGLLHDISNIIPVKDMLQIAEVLGIDVMPE